MVLFTHDWFVNKGKPLHTFVSSVEAKHSTGRFRAAINLCSVSLEIDRIPMIQVSTHRCAEDVTKG